MVMSGYRRRGTTTSKRNKRSGKKYPSSSVPSAGYRNMNAALKHKIDSYQTLWNQTRGPATCPRPSPAALNSLAKWVDKGAVIHTVSSTQIARWSKTTKKYTTAASVKNVLCSRFGKAPIKAVTRGKSGNFLVATTPTWRGKTFRFPR